MEPRLPLDPAVGHPDEADRTKRAIAEHADERTIVSTESERGRTPPDPSDGTNAESGLGICLSGGGIRSASFNLGTLRILADTPSSEDPGATSMFDDAAFLSTVSGGGYIGAAFALTSLCPADKRPAARDAIDRRLRNRSTYLLSYFSGPWPATVQLVQGLLLNLIVLGLMGAALLWPIGWLAQPTYGVPSPRLERTAPGGVKHIVEFETSGVSFDGTATTGSKSTKRTLHEGYTETKGNTISVDGTLRLQTAFLATLKLRGVGDDHAATYDGKGTTSPQPSRLYEIPCEEHDGVPWTCKLTFGSDIGFEKTPRGLILVPSCDGHRCLAFPQSYWLRVVAITGFIVLLSTLITTSYRSREVGNTRKLLWTTRVLTAGLIAFGAYFVLDLARRGQFWDLEPGQAIAPSIAGVVAIATAAGGVIASVGGSNTGGGGLGGRVKSVLPRIARVIATLAISLAVPALAIYLGVLLILFSGSVGHGWIGLAIEAVLIAVLTYIWLHVDIDEWSLFPKYRDALGWAFLGPDPGDAAREGTDVPLSRLRAARPHLIVNAVANISDSSSYLPGASDISPTAIPTFPGRRCVPWVFEADRIGSPELGWFPLDDGTDRSVEVQTIDGFSAVAKGMQTRLSLGSAVAISGAAVAPTMGKFTRRRYSAALALANIRLGAWYPNPQMRLVADRWEPPTPAYLVREITGSHNSADRLVYLTDGGHYDNLGLVELVRRNVREIVCFDAAGDHASTFRTLGEAIGLAGADHGITIDVDPRPLAPLQTEATHLSQDSGLAPLDHCVGLVTWPGDDAPTGWVLYAKATVTADAPWDVLSYRDKHPTFPFDSTASQLYDQTRFDAYRQLGVHVGQHVAATIRYIRDGVHPMWFDQRCVELLDSCPGTDDFLGRAAALRRHPTLLDRSAADEALSN